MENVTLEQISEAADKLVTLLNSYKGPTLVVELDYHSLYGAPNRRAYIINIMQNVPVYQGGLNVRQV